MCFITLGDKNLLKNQLEEKGLKFAVKELPIDKDLTEKLKKKGEGIASIHFPGIKIDWVDDEQYRQVLYGVKILPNGATSEIEGSSNLNTLTERDVESIINWIEETPSDPLGTKDISQSY